MILGGLPSFPSFRRDAEPPNAIIAAASRLKLQLQQAEEQRVQYQYRCEELSKKRGELLEVLRVFEMIEENEKAKTRQLEFELAHAEREAIDRYRAALGTSDSWTRLHPSKNDVFGPTMPNNLAADTNAEDTDKHSFFRTLVPAREDDSSRNTIPQFCKQMIISLIPSGEDSAAMKPQGNEPRKIKKTENGYSTNPRAPLIPEAVKENGLTRKQHPKKVLALEKAKNKAAETFKTMPHKARRKLKAAHAPKFAPRKTLAYTGEALRSMASGLGSIGGLWNTHQRLEESLPASETWPEAVRSFLAPGSSIKIMGAETATEMNV